MTINSIQVVAGIIQNELQQVLISKRLPHKPLGGFWEFPGGKIEPGETPFAALKRELFEEVNLNVIKAEPFLTTQHFYDEKYTKVSSKCVEPGIPLLQNERRRVYIILQCWRVIDYDGSPYGKELQTIRWINLKKLPTFEFPEANKQIVSALMSSL